ncbi:MAG: hypothetical protein LBQ24_04735 [Candidatus Peribacteria bacterium]|nr:hypothetical protein [Candidatus Peribacteria bacterium]
MHNTHIFIVSHISLNPQLLYLTRCVHDDKLSLVQTAPGLSLNDVNPPYVKKFEASLYVGTLRQLPQYEIA